MSLWGWLFGGKETKDVGRLSPLPRRLEPRSGQMQGTWEIPPLPPIEPLTLPPSPSPLGTEKSVPCAVEAEILRGLFEEQFRGRPLLSMAPMRPEPIARPVRRPKPAARAPAQGLLGTFTFLVEKAPLEPGENWFEHRLPQRPDRATADPREAIDGQVFVRDYDEKQLCVVSTNATVVRADVFAQVIHSMVR